MTPNTPTPAATRKPALMWFEGSDHRCAMCMYPAPYVHRTHCPVPYEDSAEANRRRKAAIATGAA